MGYLCREPARRQIMGPEARRRIGARCDWEAIAMQTLDHYGEVRKSRFNRKH